MNAELLERYFVALKDALIPLYGLPITRELKHKVRATENRVRREHGLHTAGVPISIEIREEEGIIAFVPYSEDATKVIAKVMLGTDDIVELANRKYRFGY